MLKIAKALALTCVMFAAACAAQAQTPRAATIEDAAWLGAMASRNSTSSW